MYLAVVLGGVVACQPHASLRRWHRRRGQHRCDPSSFYPFGPMKGGNFDEISVHENGIRAVDVRDSRFEQIFSKSDSGDGRCAKESATHPSFPHRTTTTRYSGNVKFEFYV